MTERKHRTNTGRWKVRATEQKRLKAQERQAKYDALTTAEKLAKLDQGGFAATKERTRLLKAK